MICETEYCDNFRDYGEQCRECYEKGILRETRQMFIDLDSHEGYDYSEQIKRSRKIPEEDYRDTIDINED